MYASVARQPATLVPQEGRLLACGNLSLSTHPRGQTSILTYGGLNQRTRSDFADGSFTEFAYDSTGSLIRATDSETGTLVLEYDVFDRLTRETTPQGTVTYTYDDVGRRTSMTAVGQPPTIYTYDASSMLRTITQVPLNPVTIDYDTLGRRTLLMLPNGVSTEYQYDTASRLTAQIYRNALGLLGNLTYEYDPAGNRIAVGGSFARTLLPDPIATATYDSANQQFAFGDKTMTYDANGSLETITDPGGTTTFTWDAQNQLTALSGPATTASFRYDALGRRIEKVINGKTSQFTYDGFNIVREIVNGAEANYLQSLNVDEALIRTDGPTVLTYLADALRSTVALADQTGALVTTYTYGPFGRTLASGDSSPNPFQHTGRENDLTGLYYYRARYYSLVGHRNISEDPFNFALTQMLRQSSTEKLLGRFSRQILLKQPASFNLYLYLNNNPIRFRDPFGLVILVGGAGVSAVGGTGVEISGGGFIDTASEEAGVFGSAGLGAGINASADVFGGLIWGELRGITTNSNFVFGFVSVTLIFDLSTGEFVGFTAGVGPVIPGIPPVQFSQTISVTETICLANCPPPPPPECLECRK